jgi:3-hydroxyisobutyrate dehydrogenase
MMRVGFVGMGRMGAPMVRRLVEAGHEVRVLGRTAEKRESITELGATAVTNLADTGRLADAVVVCVFTDEQVREVCLDSDLVASMPAESVLVLHTTGSPRTAETIAGRGVEVVDAPVSGGPHDIAAGHVTLFVGGGDAAVERVRPLLAGYGDPILHVGPIGAGQRVKLINNTVFAAQIGLIAEAVKLGERLGVDESKLLASLPRGSAGSRALDSVARAGSVESFVRAVGEFVGKDVEVTRKTAADLGTDLGKLDGIVGAGLGA